MSAQGQPLRRLGERLVRRGWSVLRARMGSGRLLWRARRIGAPVPSATPLAELLTVVLATKVTNATRHALLETVAGHVGPTLRRSDVRVAFADASSDDFRASNAAIVGALSDDVAIVPLDRSLHASYEHLLGEVVTTPYSYVQFDDQVAAGADEAWLRAACLLLERWRGLVDVVSVLWPLDVTVDQDARVVRVAAHGERRTSRRPAYAFGPYPPRRPVVVDEVEGIRFGIFENFTYGFYFNHLVTRTDDYRRRIAWYRQHLPDATAQQIELAASGRTFGPWWTHLALPLDPPVALLDLDHQHTGASERGEHPANRAVHEALAAGYAVETYVRDVP